MTTQEIQDFIREVMGKDPTEMLIRYYEGLIQTSADHIAEEQARIRSLQERIDELKEVE